MRHVASMYADRGDMKPHSLQTDVVGTREMTADTARQSGAYGLYEPLSAPRF